MVNIVGTISVKELQKRNIRGRMVKRGGTLLGSAIITDVKNIPGVSWCRADIRRNKQGLYAVRYGVYIRPVSAKIVNDNSFKGV